MQNASKYKHIRGGENFMPLLQVRDIPKELYEKISQAAQLENRSISQQAVVLLEDALNAAQKRKMRLEYIFEEIDALNIKNADNLPDPAKLIREDRDR
jgi:hypothetical protein